MMGYGYGLMGLFGMSIPIILIGLIVYAIVKMAEGSNKGNSRSSNSAIEILKERFAKGEISEEEYKEKKKMLEE